MHKTAGISLLIAVALATASYANAKPVKRKSGHAYQAQIACTAIGCVEVPRGCGQTPGRTWSGMPTGNDVIVCPRGIPPGPLVRR
jgi:hypothetical protein